MNVIFFLTYPIVVVIGLCSSCFRTYDSENETDKCYESVNMIVVSDDPYKKVIKLSVKQITN